MSQITAPRHPLTAPPQRSLTMSFASNALMPLLVGDHDRHLARIEQRLSVRLACKGNRISITGADDSVSVAEAALAALYRQLERGEMIDGPKVDAVLRLMDTGAEPRLPLSDLPAIRTRKGAVGPRSQGQAGYMECLTRHEMVFALGPAGTGKTYLAVAQAVAMLTEGKVERIVLSRPAVEAGERLGFLPGDMKEKVDPYLRPLYDALNDLLPGDTLARRMASGEIEIAPLAFMRGRTLSHAFVILDEAQNTTPMQMKMFLTRMGEGTRMVITGDLTQIDLPPNTRSGLADALETLEGIQGIGVMRFSNADVVRHPLVGRIVDAYDRRYAAVTEHAREQKLA
ncbi:PhoH family protein [Acidocella sp.]|uniref:PhoH family protein n=1 Tax=Acidocella sp. TaxID=50710 RepID=UPI0038D045FE